MAAETGRPTNDGERVENLAATCMHCGRFCGVYIAAYPVALGWYPALRLQPHPHAWTDRIVSKVLCQGSRRLLDLEADEVRLVCPTEASDG